MFTYLIDKDPVTYSEAVTSPDAVFWKEAIKSELDSIIENHIWELVDLPPGTKALDSKWIFKKKLRPDGTIDKFKARLVAKGFRQKKEIDYFDTYSPVARLSTIRILLAIASIHKLWNDKFDSVLITNGYKINESNKCVYSKFNGDKGVILCVYVDDILIIESILWKFGQYDSSPAKTPLDCQQLENLVNTLIDQDMNTGRL
ncbi:putative mitochondrial protein AtMg00820 [Tasmannia lanceolata]|uniref:putative mitochondrial protein AtMg00820 n=1 Tax=Tasmannia lanceolata TaxID=3420 RepID=UPI0040633A3F